MTVGLLLTCAIIVDSIIPKTTFADVNDAWASSSPQISKIGDITQDEAISLPPVCIEMIIPVVRVVYQQLLTNNETHCMVQKSEGLLDDAVSVYMPNGSSKAYPVYDSLPGKPVFIDVPNSPAELMIHSDPSWPGVNTSLFREFGNHLIFNNNLLAPSYSITSPDTELKYPDRNHLLASSAPSTFTNDGDYVVVEVDSYGFVRINLTTLQMVSFATNTVVNSSGSPLGAVTAISPSGKYAAVAYNAPDGWGSKYFKVIDIDSCGSSTAAYSGATSTCKTTNYWAQLSQTIPNLYSIRNVVFANDNSLSFAAITKIGSTFGYARYYITAPGQPMRLENYLALGDSFASGEGTFNYKLGTDTDVNKCHQSIFSYPFLMEPRVGSTESMACSGAVIGNIFKNNNQKINQLKDVEDTEISEKKQENAILVHLPGVITQLRVLNNDNPQVVTISIGGNDIGFSNIIKRCIIPFNNGSSLAQNCYKTYEDRKELIDSVIGPQFNRLVQTYKSLETNDPARRVYVIGYPQLVNPGGDCGDNVRFSGPDTVFASELVSYLDSVIKRAADKAGVQYIDTQHSFDGHRLCESGDKAVNGLTEGNDTIFRTGNESYHPNKLGHQLLASTILDQTHNLTTPMPDPQDVIAPSSDDNQAESLLGTPPVVSRSLYQVLNDKDDNLEVLLPGDSDVNYTSYGGKGIVMPGTQLNTVLHSDPVDVGILSVNESGDISGRLHIPSDTVPGFHVLHMYGKNKFGDPIDIQKTVYIEASANDYDGDGVINTVDSCPSLPNSGHDVDKDGIDDACDPEIGTPPTPAPEAPTVPSDDDLSLPAKPIITPKIVEASSNGSSGVSFINVNPVPRLFSRIESAPLHFMGEVAGDSTAKPPRVNQTPRLATSSVVTKHSPILLFVALIPAVIVILVSVTTRYRQRLK
ncbi:MAG: SGNH/GDSL hydrolase family protein [Candidatus Saccharimonadales bacterium]